MDCWDTRLEVINVNLKNGKIELTISNEGSVAVLGYIAKFVGSTDAVTEQINVNLGELGVSKNEISLSKVVGAVKKIEIYPLLEKGVCNSLTIFKAGEDDYTHFLDTSLIAAYDFDNNVKDVSGRGNDGTLQGDAVYSIGKKGNSVEFANGIVSTNYNSGNLMESTIEAWIFDKLGPVGRYKAIVQINVDGDDALYLYPTSNKVGFWPCHGQAGQINSNQWHHVVVSHDGSKIKYYVDGNKVNEIGSCLDIKDWEFIRIGGINAADSERFVGSIDLVAIYNRALTEDEIKEHASL